MKEISTLVQKHISKEQIMRLKKVACIETLYLEIPFIERINAAAQDGFEYIEFWGWEGKDLTEIKRAAEGVAIGIAGFSGDAAYSLVDPEHKEKYLDFYKKSLDVAEKLGAKYVVIHSNALDEKGLVVNHYRELSDTVKLCAMFGTLAECAKLADQKDILTVLEPLNTKIDHVGNFLTKTKMAAEITRLIGSPNLKVMYDVYHMQINEGDLCGNIKKYADQLGHVHVADSPGRHEPGTGEINYKKVLECLEETDYDGLVGYELFPKTTTEEAVKKIMELYK